MVSLVGAMPVNVGGFGAVQALWLVFEPWSSGPAILAFNFVWHIDHLRSVGQRFSNYLSVVLIGPVLVFTAIGITASVSRPCSATAWSKSGGAL